MDTTAPNMRTESTIRGRARRARRAGLAALLAAPLALGAMPSASASTAPSPTSGPTVVVYNEAGIDSTHPVIVLSQPGERMMVGVSFKCTAAGPVTASAKISAKNDPEVQALPQKSIDDCADPNHNGRNRFGWFWDGFYDDFRQLPVPDGRYTMTVTVTDQLGRQAKTDVVIQVDTRQPGTLSVTENRKTGTKRVTFEAVNNFAEPLTGVSVMSGTNEVQLQRGNPDEWTVELPAGAPSPSSLKVSYPYWALLDWDSGTLGNDDIVFHLQNYFEQTL